MHDICVDRKPYGKFKYGDKTHVDKVEYSFRGIRGDVKVVYEVWDNDWRGGNEEIEISINGNYVSNAPYTGNEQWSDFQEIVLLDIFVNDDRENILSFNHTKNPPKTWWWAVRNVHIPGCVVLAWENNTEPDLAGYIIYYGKSSRNYNTNIDVGDPKVSDGCEYMLTGLEENIEYFFAATAYDKSENESDYSDEVKYTIKPDINAARGGKIRVTRGD